MESNFVDYVKIQCRSGKGGRGSMHLSTSSIIPMAVLTVATVARVVLSFCEATITTGRCSICAISVTSLLSMEAMVVRTSVMALTARTYTSMFLVARWCIMLRLANMCATLWRMVRRFCCSRAEEADWATSSSAQQPIRHLVLPSLASLCRR